MKPTPPEPSKTDTAGPPPSAELIRRQLRLALIKSRGEAKLTQKVTANELDWSVSKVVRIEQGVVPISPTDVKAMLDLFATDSEERIASLVQLARDARTARSWDDFSVVMSPTFQEYVGQEPSASHIWKHEPYFIPGLTQTEDFTRELLEALDSDHAELRAEMRAERQLLLENPTVPELHFVIGEAAFRCQVGGPEIMRGQIRKLIDLNQRDGINLHLLPFRAGPHRAMGVAFSVMQFSHEDLDDVLFLEDGEQRSSSIDDPHKLNQYLSDYNKLEEIAASFGSFAEQAETLMKDLYT